ncbi:MAG: gliding motility-associated C-terminal domain-containing protein [Elusimicrobiota bacterium]|jgi:gliding motility-associated-like protein
MYATLWRQILLPFLAASLGFGGTMTPKGFSFSSSGLSNRILTPNGDSLNDVVIFTFSNPRDSQVTGRIYDIQGKYVADLQTGPTAGTTLKWDGKVGGSSVPGGIYVYVIEAESAVYSGTVVVVK